MRSCQVTLPLPRFFKNDQQVGRALEHVTFDVEISENEVHGIKARVERGPNSLHVIGRILSDEIGYHYFS